MVHQPLDEETTSLLTDDATTGAAEINSYGGIDERVDPASEVSPASLPIDHDTVNHGHAYTDAVVNTVLFDGTELQKGRVSYWSLVKDNGNFRMYLISYLVTHAGEWFTYVASISAIEQIHASNGITSRTSISILVALRLLPNALFTSIGGVLADSYDRRVILLTLDMLGSLVALLFLLAYHLKSISTLYLATAMQMTIAAIYEPNRSSIVPMLVSGEESLKKAMTISAMAWSLMTSIGSSTGGFAAEYLGIAACFWIDSVSYVVSAVFIWWIKGTFRACDAASLDEQSNEKDKKHTFSPSHFIAMFTDGISYLLSEPWGAFVFFKFCAALVFGAADILNVSFSERGIDIHSQTDVMEGASQRLGILFGFVGVGCLIGPLIIDGVTDMNKLESMEWSCLGSFLLMGIGCWGLSLGWGFVWVCFFTAVRSAGSSVVWVQSSLLLQKFSTNTMLGRVMSVSH